MTNKELLEDRLRLLKQLNEATVDLSIKQKVCDDLSTQVDLSKRDLRSYLDIVERIGTYIFGFGWAQEHNVREVEEKIKEVLIDAIKTKTERDLALEMYDKLIFRITTVDNSHLQDKKVL